MISIFGQFVDKGTFLFQLTLGLIVTLLAINTIADFGGEEVDQ
jgi:hypothetical protein